MVEDAGESGRIANTWQNRAVGRALRAARLAMEDSRQASFAEMLGNLLGMPLSAAGLSGWENGRRAVPAAALFQAALASGQSLDLLLADEQEPDVVTWVEEIGLGERMNRLETDNAQLLDVVARLQHTVQIQGELLDRVAKEAGVTRPVEGAQRSEDPAIVERNRLP